MNDFWLSCGHHLLDRDAGGGLVVTDEFLKVYFARPELAPPPDAGVAAVAGAAGASSPDIALPRPTAARPNIGTAAAASTSFCASEGRRA